MRINTELFPDIEDQYRSFWELPDCIEPTPNPKTPSEKYIILIPLFEDAFYGTQPDKADNKIDAIIRGAIWARYSWLTNSDTRDYNVTVKLYIEDVMLPRLQAVLEKNYIDLDADVVTFHCEPLPTLQENPRGTWGRLSKCTRALWDRQFTEQYLIVFDSDLFAPPNTSFFKKLDRFVTQEQIGILDRKHNHNSATEYEKSILKKMAKGWTLDEVFTKYTATEKITTPTHLIKDMASVLECYRQPQTAIYICPTTLQDSPFIQELENVLPMQGGEEETFGYLLHKHNVPTFTLNDIGMTWGCVSYVLHEDNQNSDHLLHGKPNYNQVEIVLKFREIIGIK